MSGSAQGPLSEIGSRKNRRHGHLARRRRPEGHRGAGRTPRRWLLRHSSTALLRQTLLIHSAEVDELLQDRSIFTYMCVLGDLTYEPRRRPRKRRSERKEAPPRTAASAAGRGGACIRVHFVGAEAAAGRLGSMSQRGLQLLQRNHRRSPTSMAMVAIEVDDRREMVG